MYTILYYSAFASVIGCVRSCVSFFLPSLFRDTILFVRRYLNGQTPQQPPPAYSSPFDPFQSHREINSIHAISPYGLTQCSIHRLQPCGCLPPVQCKVEVRPSNSRRSLISPLVTIPFLVGRTCRLLGCPLHIPSPNRPRIRSAAST